MKIAVVTYIFGENKEKLREPLVKEDDVEYICVTDQDLVSETWKIIKDPMPDIPNLRDKFVHVKYNPFKYTDADIIVVIDGSVEVKTSMKKFIPLMEENELLLKKHPGRDNLADELTAWRRLRKMPVDEVNKFHAFASKLGFDLKSKMLVESCVLIFKNDDKIKNLCSSVIGLMQMLSNDPSRLIMTNQCALTFLLQTYFKDVKFSWINQCEYFNRYGHNSIRRVE